MSSHISNGVQKLQQKYTETVRSNNPFQRPSNERRRKLLLTGGAVALGLGVAFGAFMGWMGAFKSISWSPSEVMVAFQDSRPPKAEPGETEEAEEKEQPRSILFLRYKGPYNKNLGNVFQKLTKIRAELLNAEDCGGVPLEDFAPLVGVYLDNPMSTPPEECRAIVGFSVPGQCG